MTKIRNKGILIFLIFLIIIILFAIFSTKLLFHDSFQYITVAKEYAGISNSNVYTGHSTLYPFILAQFLKVFPSFIIIKIVNVIWLILITLLIYIFTKSKKTLLLWVFSPLLWYTSIQTSPILPASFFLIFSYFMLKKWSKFNQKKYFIFSSLLMGIAISIWSGALFFSLFLIFAFFYDKMLWNILVYFLFLLPGLFLGFILDYIYFGFPFYSYIRIFGAASTILIGLNYGGDISLRLEALLSLIIISPLLFFIYKINFKNYKRETIFIVLSVVFLFVYQFLLKYLLFISPLIIIMLATILDKKRVFLHCLISLVLIILLTYSYFGENRDTYMMNDLKSIKEDFGFTEIISGRMNNGGIGASDLNTLYWGNDLWIYSGDDYYNYLNNKTITSEYSLVIKPKIKDISKSLTIKSTLEMDDMQDFDDLPVVSNDNIESVPSDYELIKCYKILCVYEKTF